MFSSVYFSSVMCCYRDQRQYKKAAELLQKSLDIRVSLVGSDQPVVSSKLRPRVLCPFNVQLSDLSATFYRCKELGPLKPCSPAHLIEAVIR